MASDSDPGPAAGLKIQPTRGVAGDYARRLATETIILICNKRCPIGYEELLSWAQRETGLKRDTVKDHVMVLVDTHEISVDKETGIVSQNKGDKK
jgi:hypothetical protein